MTTITQIRPTSVAIQGVRNTTVVGTANLVTAVTDGSDATWVTATIDKQYIRYNLTDISALAGNQRVKSCRLFIRNARDGSTNGTTQDTTTTLNNCTAAHTGSCAPVGSFTNTRGLTNAVTSNGLYAYAAPCGKGWDATQVNALCIQVQWFKARYGSIVAFQKVYELYVEVEVSNQPAITGTPTVTNFTNNATPTINWNYLSADDAPQTSWQEKIFDAATIATPGFNPDTSKAVWDSKQQYGNQQQVTVPIPLQNGISYTSYTNVAQDWPGPQGKYWWSGWVASAPFTVSFVPPATPTIASAQVLSEANQYRAVLQIFAPINLLSADNASFEGGGSGSLGNWAPLTNCTIVPSNTQAADGTWSMRMSSSAAGDMTAQCAADVNKQPQVIGGQQYTFVIQFRAAVSARACNVGVQWKDNIGANIGGISYGGNATDSTANFNTQATLTTTAPDGAYQALVTAKVQATGAAAEQHYVDKVQIIAGSSTSWGPGGYTNDQGDVYLERGEYIADDRGPADNWFHPQVASCGSVLRTHEYGFSGNPANSADTIHWAWLNKTIPVEGETPPGMLDFYPGTTSGPYIRLGEWNQSVNNTAFMVPAVQGQTHIFSVWVWTDTGTYPNVRAVIDWRDIDGTILASTNGPNVTLTTTPQRLFVTGSPPANAELATGALAGTGINAGPHWLFTRAGFGLGTIPVDGKPSRGNPTGILTTGTPEGVTWMPVRWRDDGELMGDQVRTNYPPGRYSAQTEWFADYEYPPGRPVIYRVSVAYSSLGNVIRSSYAYIVIYGAPPPTTLLRSVTNPVLQIAVNRRKDASLGFDDDVGIFHPLGADGAPALVRDWYSGEDMQGLTVIASTGAQSQRMRQVIRAADVMQLQWPQGGRTYCVITDRRIAETVSSDVDFCDVDGQVQTSIKYEAIDLSYLETQAP